LLGTSYNRFTPPKIVQQQVTVILTPWKYQLVAVLTGSVWLLTDLSQNSLNKTC